MRLAYWHFNLGSGDMTLYTASPDDAKKLITEQVKGSFNTNKQHNNINFSNTQTVTLSHYSVRSDDHGQETSLEERIHGCHSPISNTDRQEEEGDDGVEKS